MRFSGQVAASSMNDTNLVVVQESKGRLEDVRVSRPMAMLFCSAYGLVMID